ncbi:MAG TPA: hypothetical protein PKN50_03080 [Spirochaetota bacterium]|nr:hypothetical protein [Spirochaetota bacterium]
MMSRKKNRVAFLLLLAALLLQYGCITSPVAVTSSTTPVNDKKIVMNYGPVQGTHRVWSVFGLWMVGRPDIDLAIQDALKKKGGDALINVSCYQKTSWFFFVSENKVVVEGEAVSFDAGSLEKDRGKQTIKSKK